MKPEGVLPTSEHTRNCGLHTSRGAETETVGACGVGRSGHNPWGSDSCELRARRRRCRYTLPVGLADHGAFPVPAGARGPSPRPARRPRPARAPPPARPPRSEPGARSPGRTERRALVGGARLAPPHPAPRSPAARPAPSPRHLPALPGPPAALPPSPPSRPARAARLPQAPLPPAFLWTDAQTPAGG